MFKKVALHKIWSNRRLKIFLTSDWVRGIFKKKLPRVKKINLKKLAVLFSGMKIRSKRCILLVALVLSFLLIFVILDQLFPLPKTRLFPPVSTLITDKNDQLLRVYTAADDIWRINTPLSAISPLHQKLTLAYEDQWFYWHPGINPISIGRAAITNFKAGKVLVGGSTITMQIARMIEPKERTLQAKIKEVWRAFQLEFHYSKKELLEIYFNLAPYGGNIEGVGAAAALYFGKQPSRLSIGEIALLTALPNSPTRLRPDANSQLTLNARNKVLKRLLLNKAISVVQYQDALSEPIPSRRQELPFQAPHFCDFLKQRHPRATHLATTLDQRILMVCQNLLTEHIRGWWTKGITNGAVVVIENASRNVLALVGSADFFDEKHAGQVNGAVAPRSPGSALKPFIYTLALDEGLISQKSILEDVPVDYSGYSPENFDGLYHGVVTVEQALAQSLNVPAINLTAALKKRGIYALLKSAGFTTLNRPSHQYGLPIILGACEVKLVELTNLYACLANGGQYQPFRMLQRAEQPESHQLFSPEAAFVVTEILTQHERPDFPAYWERAFNLPKVAWKTGTSYGHKDAWSIGYNRDFTIGVWVGNFSGKGVPELVGAEAAAPLLFNLFNALTAQHPSSWFEIPAGLATRQVCAVSGMPANEICPETIEEFYIPGVSPITRCTIHQQFSIDAATGFRLCPHCRQNRKYHDQLFEIWPAKLATWMERNGFPIKKIPAHFPLCTSLIHGNPPIIRSPSENCEYVLRAGVLPAYQKILLDASVGNDVQKIYWFIDGNLLATASPRDKVFYTPVIGNHKLLCMDDFGRSTEMVLRVR